MAQKTLKKLALIVAVSALCAGVFSCQKDADEKGGFTTGGDGSITFGVSFGNPSQDLTVKGSLDLKDDEGNVVLTMEEATFDTPSPEQTKATLVNDVDGFVETFGGVFQVRGFQGTTPYQEIKNKPVTMQATKYPDGTHQWTLENHVSWPAGTDLEFFAWAPEDEAVKDDTFFPGRGGIESVQFSYTVENPLEQPDLMFAHYYGNGSDNELGGSKKSVAGVATMEFSHALSSVSFQADSDDLKLEGITINSITLKNIVSAATCTVSFGEEETSYEWLPSTEKKNYTSDFNSTPVEAISLAPDYYTTFMLIPQVFKENTEASIVLNITKNCSTFDITYRIPDTTDWKAGVTTIYTIRYNGLDIEINDEVEDDVKSNLEIKNVGGKPAYIRVLVTGAWVNTEGDIVALWDPANEAMGSFSPAIFAGDSYETDDWFRMDGFFYYKHVLPVGATAAPLFDTYKALQSGKPNNIKLSDHLEIDIVSQAVVVDAGKAAITTAWGATAAGFVE